MTDLSRAPAKARTNRYWALCDLDGNLVADKSGVLTWHRRKDVPWNDEERAVRVIVSVTPVERADGD